MDQSESIFSKENELIRIESFDKIDQDLEAPLRIFFRRLGVAHVYDEYVVPVMAEGSAVGLAAVKDRAWPPWGVGAHTIHALALAAPVASESAGLCNVFLSEEDVGNIGLVSAVYAGMLNTLEGRGVKEISYIVLEGSVCASRVLSKLGFRPTEELYLSHGNRYNVYTSELRTHAKAMALDQKAGPELLDSNLSDEAFAATIQLFSVTSIGSRPFWSELAMRPEILPNTGGIHRASRPGGAPIRVERAT